MAKTGGFWVGCWVFGLEVGCQPFFFGSVQVGLLATCSIGGE